MTKARLKRAGVCATVVCSAGLASCWASDLHVGPGREFARIEDAVAKAASGDRVVVHARQGNAAYDKVAVIVSTTCVEIVAGEAGIRLSGEGFEYSGVGRVPRAIVQFDPGADGASLCGFELAGARNESNNGAGVRINQASGVTIRGCDIHDNDMGVMSNGSLDAAGKGVGAKDQRFEVCHIHHNGSKREQGYSHNLYLGGESATLSRCVVEASIAGHNIKSRAKTTTIESCLVRGSANREIDLVDAKGFTDREDSSALILNSIIVKRENSAGNRGVVHFGRDGQADRRGRLTFASTIIVTHYATPAVQVTTPDAEVQGVGSLVVNTARRRESGALVAGGAQVERLDAKK